MKVIVGLSGGVDSAATLIKLLQDGYQVEAMFMRNWDAAINNDILGNPTINDNICPQEVDYIDAADVCKKLGVKFHRVDFVQEYWERVFTYFLNEYRMCRTPNPDILCNKEIKFKAFLEKAIELDADYIAMGHYARVEHGNRHRLMRGKDLNKDQSYFLCQLTERQLAKTLFPIGEMIKKDVRQLVRDYDIKIADKKDSTGVCFIGERDFKQFLKNYIIANPGNMETLSGEVVGQHDGIMYYTIGQRKGLNIGGPGSAWFVIGKDIQRNVLLVGQNEDIDYLSSNRAIITDVNWINERFTGTLEADAKFRYRQADNRITLKWLDDKTLEVVYLKPVKAVTPGQAAVFYDGDYVLGGGTIDKVYMNNNLRRY